jgi:hypothetical protein
MIWYDIYSLQLGFHQVKVVGKLAQIWKETAVYRKRNNTQKILKHGIHQI